jgi:hypothetical protein
VLDVTGRALRVLEARAGGTGVTWDGADDAGRAVPAGIYFARLEAGSAVATRRFAVVR